MFHHLFKFHFIYSTFIAENVTGVWMSSFPGFLIKAYVWVGMVRWQTNMRRVTRKQTLRSLPLSCHYREKWPFLWMTVVYKLLNFEFSALIILLYTWKCLVKSGHLFIYSHPDWEFSDRIHSGFPLGFLVSRQKDPDNCCCQTKRKHVWHQGNQAFFWYDTDCTIILLSSQIIFYSGIHIKRRLGWAGSGQAFW